MRGPSKEDSPVGLNLWRVLQWLTRCLQQSDFDFCKQMKYLVSTQNTSKFALAFFTKLSHGDVPEFVKNPLRNVNPICSEGQIIEIYAKAHACLLSIPWPITVQFSGWGKKIQFTIKEAFPNALNLLVTGCMCEKVRNKMAEIGWHQ